MGQLSGVHRDHVLILWPDIEPYIDRCFAKAKEHRWNSGDVLHLLMNRDLQLWCYYEPGVDLPIYIVLTELINYPRCRECNIFMVCGELHDDWRDDVENVVEWARLNGCQWVTAMARPGFAKAVGWERRQTYVVRGLE